jgi:hypothetical protein
MTLHNSSCLNGAYAPVGAGAIPYVSQMFSACPSRSETEETTVQRYRGKNAGDFRAKTARNIPAFEITQGDWLKQSAKAFREHTGERPGAAKELAAKLECSDKTTRSWLAGETAPSGILDLRAMARIPEYDALKRKLAAQEQALDPRVQSTIHELHALTLTLALANGGSL